MSWAHSEALEFTGEWGWRIGRDQFGVFFFQNWHFARKKAPFSFTVAIQFNSWDCWYGTSIVESRGPGYIAFGKDNSWLLHWGFSCSITMAVGFRPPTKTLDNRPCLAWIYCCLSSLPLVWWALSSTSGSLAGFGGLGCLGLCFADWSKCCSGRCWADKIGRLDDSSSRSCFCSQKE